MKKKILETAAVAFSAVLLITGICVATGNNSTTSEANIPSETTEAGLYAGVTADITEYMAEANTQVTVEQLDSVMVGASYELTAEVHERVITNDIEELNALIAECEERVNAASAMKDSCIALGYEEDNPVYLLAIEEYDNANGDLNYYQEVLNEAQKIAKEQAKYDEYPVAMECWVYLTETLGYNKYVAAGIIGNMMAEVGGQTLDLQPYLSNGRYYGLCQWALRYSAGVNNASVQGQLDYLSNTIQSEFKTFGKIYYNGFTYDAFINMTSEREAALAFAKVYERCGSGSYNVRQRNATTALEYFTN